MQDQTSVGPGVVLTANVLSSSRRITGLSLRKRSRKEKKKWSNEVNGEKKKRGINFIFFTGEFPAGSLLESSMGVSGSRAKS